MILPIQSFANWELARTNRNNNSTRNLLVENQRRRPFDWQPGMEILQDKCGCDGLPLMNEGER